MKGGGQALLDVDGPLGIGGVGVEAGHLAVQVRDLEGLLERGELGLLQELDREEQGLGSIVQAESNIRQLIQKN